MHCIPLLSSGDVDGACIIQPICYLPCVASLQVSPLQEVYWGSKLCQLFDGSRFVQDLDDDDDDDCLLHRDVSLYRRQSLVYESTIWDGWSTVIGIEWEVHYHLCSVVWFMFNGEQKLLVVRCMNVVSLSHWTQWFSPVWDQLVPQILTLEHGRNSWI